MTALPIALQSWTERAACADIPITSTWDPWFPGDDTEVHTYTDARKTCQRCPVADECLALAMAEERSLARTRRYGMRGGKTPAERAAADPDQLTNGRDARVLERDRLIAEQRRAGIPPRTVANQFGVSLETVRRAYNRPRVTS